MVDACNYTFVVPHFNHISKTFTPYMSTCIRKEGLGHTGVHVFLNPEGRPVQYRPDKEPS